MDYNQRYEVEIVEDRVLTHIRANEYGDIYAEISDQTSAQMIAGLVSIAGQVSDAAFEKISDIYCLSIISKLKKDVTQIEKDAEAYKLILQTFNRQVDEALKNIDLSNPVEATTFDSVCRTLRDNLESEFRIKRKIKGSFLDRIFRT